jgi:hypothetical protein
VRRLREGTRPPRGGQLLKKDQEVFAPSALSSAVRLGKQIPPASSQLALFQKLRQLCHVPRYVPRLIAREQMLLGLIFEIDIAQRLSIIVPHDKAAALFFDTPG